MYNLHGANRKDPERSLQIHIAENPSYEECKRNLPSLADKFMADLKKDQEALEEKKLIAEAEKLSLDSAKEEKEE